MIVNGQQSSVHIEFLEEGFVAVRIVANYNNQIYKSQTHTQVFQSVNKVEISLL